MTVEFSIKNNEAYDDEQVLMILNILINHFFIRNWTS